MLSDPSSEWSGGSTDIMSTAMLANKEVNNVIGFARSPSGSNSVVIEIENLLIRDDFAAFAVLGLTRSGATKPVS